MTEIKRYKPVGGITSCELFTLQALVSAEDMVAGQGVMVSLSDDGSHYEERMSCEQGPVSVEHTLTLCSDRSEAVRWFDHDLLQRMAIEGVAALITLASGESLRLGWSPRFGFEHLPFELRGRAGGCARVTAGQKRPHPGLCLGPNVPLKG